MLTEVELQLCLPHFNSIKVRLEQVARELSKEHGDFNSIKVRLEPGTNSPLSFLVILFQFHKGTIRTGGFSLCGE